MWCLSRAPVWLRPGGQVRMYIIVEEEDTSGRQGVERNEEAPGETIKDL